MCRVSSMYAVLISQAHVWQAHWECLLHTICEQASWIHKDEARICLQSASQGPARKHHRPGRWGSILSSQVGSCIWLCAIVSCSCTWTLAALLR